MFLILPLLQGREAGPGRSWEHLSPLGRYHHIISVQLNLSPHAICCEIPPKQHQNNPAGVNTPEILLKAFQLLQTFMAASRCVYFNVSWFVVFGFFFSTGLVPTCDNPKYSQKFLQHRRDMCKRRSKLDREHWLDSSADMLKGKFQFFIQKGGRGFKSHSPSCADL